LSPSKGGSAPNQIITINKNVANSIQARIFT